MVLKWYYNGIKMVLKWLRCWFFQTQRCQRMGFAFISLQGFYSIYIRYVWIIKCIVYLNGLISKTMVGPTFFRHGV